MKVYYLVFFITLLIQFIPTKTDKQYLWRCIVSFVPLFLFLALREGFGNDYPGYEAYFYDIHSSSSYFNTNDHMEVGYGKLNYLMPTFRSLLVLMALLACVGYVMLFYRMISPRFAWIGVVLLFLCGDKTVFMQVSGFRTAITVSLLLISYPLILNRRIVSFAAVTLLAMSIHTSALLYLPLAYLVGTKSPVTRKNAKWWLLAAILCSVLSIGVLISPFMNFVNIYFERYYTDLEMIASEGISFRQGFLITTTNLALLVFVVYFMAGHDLSPTENSFFKIAFLMVLVGFLEGGAGRSGSYYILFFIPAAVRMMTTEWRNVFAKVAFVVLLFGSFCYAFFKVWMNNPFFSYDVYRSIIGNW